MQLGILVPTVDAVDDDMTGSVRAVLMQQSLRALSVSYARLRQMVADDRVALVVTRRGESEDIEDDWVYTVGVGTVDFTKSLMDGITAHIEDFAFDQSVRDF